MPNLVGIHPVVWAPNPNKQTNRQTERQTPLFYMYRFTMHGMLTIFRFVGGGGGLIINAMSGVYKRP